MDADLDGGHGTVLDAEDAKLVALARAAMARAETGTGAAVRDADGRTYAGAAVELATLRLSALQAAVAIAVASGVRTLEAAVVVGAAGEQGIDEPGGAEAVDPGAVAVRELSPDAAIILTDRAGKPL